MKPENMKVLGRHREMLLCEAVKGKMSWRSHDVGDKALCGVVTLKIPCILQVIEL